MLILTIIFILMSIHWLITGRAFFNTHKEMIQYKIDEFDGKHVDEDKNTVNALIIIGFSVVMVILNLLYFTWAYPVDILKYPTLLMILWMFLPTFWEIIKGKLKKSKEETQEQQRAKLVLALQNIKKHSVSGKVMGLVRLSYFSYILWILLGGNI